MMKMQHLKLPPKNTNLKCTVLEIIPAFVLPHFYHTCVLASSKRPSSSFREMLKLSQIQYSVLQKNVTIQGYIKYCGIELSGSFV